MLRLGFVLTLLFVTALPAQAESVADRVAAILVSQRSPERPTQEALVDALVPLGPELLAPAFEVIALRTVPVEGQDPQVLSEPQRDVLLATFEALGHAPVASAEQAWRPGRKDLDTLCARLWIYGAIAWRPTSTPFSRSPTRPTKAIDVAWSRLSDTP